MRVDFVGVSAMGRVLLAGAIGFVVQPAWAEVLLFYNPTGPQLSGTPLPVASAAPGVTGSVLSQVGLENYWNNTNVWPVGQISSSPTITLGDYLTFTVSPDLGQAITFQDLTYSKRSYLGDGATEASIRSSENGFTTDIASIGVNPVGDETLNFNLGSMSQSSDPVTFRIYFYAAGTNMSDWDDLVSTASAGSGLQLAGNVVAVPEPTTWAMVLLGFAGLGFAGYRKGKSRSLLTVA